MTLPATLISSGGQPTTLLANDPNQQNQIRPLPGQQQQQVPGPPSEIGFPGPPSRHPSANDLESTMFQQESLFRDEPKEAPAATEAEAVPTFTIEDDGTASLMKTKKPIIHTGGHHTTTVRDMNEYFASGKGNTYPLGVGYEEDEESEATIIQYRNSKIHILSNAIFVFSSLLCRDGLYDLDYYYFYKEVPKAVMNADDDATWWNYFVNCTDDEFFPENVTNADDDHTWMDWYNNTAFMDDDNVFLPKIANPSWMDWYNNTAFMDDDNVFLPKIANPTLAELDTYEPYVSKYMMLYFTAASGFLITGVIEIVLARKYFWYRILYFLMMLAGFFGIVSAIFTNKNPLVSNICNCISCNFWAIEAVIILIQRCRGQSDSLDYDKGERVVNFWAIEAVIILIQRCRGQSDSLDYTKEERVGCLSIRKWFLIADITFVIGTVGDMTQSYMYVFGIDNWMMGYAAIVFAMGWLICAFIYLAISIYDFVQYKTYFVELLKADQDLMLDDDEDEDVGVQKERGLPADSKIDKHTFNNKSEIPFTIGSIGVPHSTTTEDTDTTKTHTNKNRSTLNTEPADSLDDFSSPPQSSNNSNSNSDNEIGGGDEEKKEDGAGNTGTGTGTGIDEEKKEDGAGNTGAGTGTGTDVAYNNNSPLGQSDIIGYLFPKGHPSSSPEKNTVATKMDYSAAASVVDNLVPGTTRTIPNNIDIAPSPNATTTTNTKLFGLMCGALSLPNDDNNNNDTAAATSSSVNVPATYTTNTKQQP
eukprot:CAMPEP_0170969674 /NCGR_PEP_ID=MMETSP0735-20130129/44101_1 /TAXON_ID=186038 /ORGANISM="Fragilariopsis kerguelensis, Strain L26-C5" /LENGTH=757 /DNA_ID=CAMNT_0011389153 /DNA_START=155 /DNA_END=2430 /DNA_ORIENTATION=+